MILRRLSQSLKEQNWAAIWIEFILLVAGVFLGIQVANWNATRVDEVRAKAYLERIKDNLNTDLQSIQRRDVFWRQVIAYGDQAIRYAETGEASEAFLQRAARTGWHGGADSQRRGRGGAD